MGVEQITSRRILSSRENTLVNEAQIGKIETLIYEEVVAVQV